MMAHDFYNGSDSSEARRDEILQDLNWESLDNLLRQGFSGIIRKNGKVWRESPPKLNGASNEAQFDYGKDKQWRWAAFWYYHTNCVAA
jgi:hypothetical protein